MAAAVSCTPPVSPHSPLRKKTKFSLSLKGKKKEKKVEEEVAETEYESPKFYPMFSTVERSPDRSDMVPPPPFVGLKNRSNLCYANAVIQVLNECPGFVEFVKELEQHIDEENREVKADSEQDEGSETNAFPKMISQFTKLLYGMKEIRSDFMENKEHCQYLTNRAGKLVLAAEPCDFMEAFRLIYSAFENHLQHDAQEFLRTLVISLHEGYQEYEKTKEPVKKKVKMQLVLEKNGRLMKKEVPIKERNAIEELFQGRLVHETKCLTCENAKQRFEDFQDVSVPVCEDQQAIDAKKKLLLSPTPKKDQEVKKHTLEWAISQFATVECLKDENKYFCENCNAYMEARISTCFDHLPSVLTLHLKRFTSVYSGYSPGFVSKITSNLETPLWLSVEEWCSEKCRRQSTTYELFGIVMHSGMTSCSGHYQAYVKMSSNSRKCLDADKSPVVSQKSTALKCGNTSCVETQQYVKETKDNQCSKSDGNRVNADQDSGNKGNGINSVGNDGKCETISNCDGKSEESLNKCQDKDGIEKNARRGKKRKSKFKLSTTKFTAKRRPSDANSSNSSMDEDEMTNKNAAKKARLEAASPERSQQVFGGKESEQVKSPEQVNCSLGLPSITKFFHKSRKKSVKNNSGKRNEGSESKKGFESAELLSSKANNQKEALSDSEQKDLPETPAMQSKCQPKESALTKSPAIRQLTFQVSEKGLTLSSKSPGKSPFKSEDRLDCNNNTNRDLTQVSGLNGEGCKSEWVQFDDSEVSVLNDADVAAVLSSAKSSFNSPYLLFYRMCKK